MNKNRRRGKDLERFLAHDLGGRRVGILGQEDIMLNQYSIEAKERKEHPVFIKKSMTQAIRNSKGERIPILILHSLGEGHENDLVVMRYSDWKSLISRKNLDKLS